jgi:Dolichyl-phosphate-mannose-protein mannosyltransferase
LRTIGVGLLLLILALELTLSIRTESQTWDEGCHIFAGYSYWTRSDYGMNPEHPPLVKLVATTPLLIMSLKVPRIQDRFFKIEAFLDGTEFVFSNDADAILFRTRVTAGIFSLLLALLVFLAAQEMFGTGAAFFALLLLVFEPNLLANGALVTTDVALSCFMFATVYALYRYGKRPTIGRTMVIGLALGLAFASKHSALLLIPIVILLAVAEVILGPMYPQQSVDTKPDARRSTGRPMQALRLMGSLVLAAIISIVILWALYGFRYSARPAGLAMNPPLSEYVHKLRPVEERIVTAVARWHAIPEGYLYGLTDVRDISNVSSSFLLGTIYPHGVWFYFPATFVIKSTLSFLLLLLLALGVVVTGRTNAWREIIFLIIPPVTYFGQAMTSGLNIGVRHILPIYPFLVILCGAAAWNLIKCDKRWIAVIAVLIAWHSVSSLRSFPVYMAYANEAWGGPSNTYNLLTDSNVDWAQQLPATREYLDKRGIKECWFAYFAATVVDTSYYGIPCHMLPVISSLWLGDQLEAISHIDGIVLVSASSWSGYETGPGTINPYEQFKSLQPTAVIQRGVFVYDGHFDIPLAAALAHAHNANKFAEQNRLSEALSEAQQATTLAPYSARAQEALGNLLMRLDRKEEARETYQKALAAARANHPEFQKERIERLEKEASGQ